MARKGRRPLNYVRVRDANGRWYELARSDYIRYLWDVKGWSPKEIAAELDVSYPVIYAAIGRTAKYQKEGNRARSASNSLEIFRQIEQESVEDEDTDET